MVGKAVLSMKAFSGIPFLTCNAAATMYGPYCEGNNVQVIKVEAAVTRTNVRPIFETYCCKGWVYLSHHQQNSSGDPGDAKALSYRNFGGRIHVYYVISFQA